MPLKIGICGLPNSGKSTLIKLLSKVEVEIAPYPFTTLKAKEVAVPVISQELINLHQITRTPELRPPYLIFVDVPGLIKGAHQGLGLGNEFLSYLRACDVILEVVRNFKNKNVPHIEGEIDPLRDILIIEEEIIISEKRIIKENIEKLKKINKNDKTLLALKNLLANLEPFKRFPEYREDLKKYSLLLLKDWFLLINGENIENLKSLCFKKIYNLDLKFELDLSEDEELKKELGFKTEEFLENLRKDIGLIEFYTFTKDITQAWFIKENSTILECAELIHSDFKKQFKAGEVINRKEFLSFKNWQLAKEKGALKIVGKDYLVEEGDIIRIII